MSSLERYLIALVLCILQHGAFFVTTMVNVKYYLGYINKRLKGYVINKSRISPGESYYFKCKNCITIRLSTHNLHPNQERYNMINIIVNENGYTINGKYVQIKAVESKIIKRSIVESIFLEIELYRRLPKIL